MRFRFLAKGPLFFDRFEEQGQKTVESCRLMLALLCEHETMVDLRARVDAIAQLEHECDLITHAVMTELRKRWFTPFDRDEIQRLILTMDDVIDFVEAAAQRLALFGMCPPPPEATELASVLVSSAECMLEAVRGVRHLDAPDQVLEKCQEMTRLESEADTQLRGALARLFRDERDPIAIMKWKEICELLEMATDRCEDVANVIEGVVLENA